MALEASKQLADENRNITGYCIKDATFHHPLVVSRDNTGVEVQLYVRSIKDSSDKASAWSEFRICVYENSQWTETCRGTVALEYDEPLTEVDAGTEAAALQAHHRHLFDHTNATCNRTLPVTEMYAYLHARGLEYGPAFQSLQHISCTEEGGEAIAQVTPFKWCLNSNSNSNNSNSNHPQPHLIHPTTLDAILQLMMVSLSHGARENIPTSIPTRIGKLWIASAGISCNSTAAAVNAYARASFTGTRKAEASMFCLDGDTGSLLLVMEEVETTTVATTTTTSTSTARDASSRSSSEEESNNAKITAAKGKKNLCYNLTWKPDLDLLLLLDGNSALTTYCETARPSVRDLPADFYNDLGYVLLMFVSKTLEALSCEGQEEGEVDLRLERSGSEPGCISGSRAGTKSHIHRYIQWMKHQKRRFEAGELPYMHPTNPKWTRLMHDAEYRELLCARLESTNRQGKLFMKVGRSLPKLLTGDLDPLAFMFQDDCIPGYYREVNDEVFCFEPFARYLDAMAHKDPGLRVLEIGAGVGAVTGDVLRVLAPSSSSESSSGSEGDHQQESSSSCTPRFARYDYTDISPAFFEKAEDTFQRHGARMNFKALDIESDPSKQGFEAGAYDLIVAGSVGLHTPCMEVRTGAQVFSA